MAIGFDPGGPRYQFTETHQWIRVFGAHYALGVDGIGLTLVLMTAILTPVVILASWHDGDEGRWGAGAFFGWMLALEALSICVFSATDVFLFYVIFEATLIPVYFLIGGFGGRQRSARRGEVPDLQPVRRAADAGRRRRPVRRLRAHVDGSDVPALRAVAGPDPPGRGPLDVRRVLRRVRDQGPDGARAHLAARRRRGGQRRHLGDAGQRARQDRHLRDDPVLPRAVPRGLPLGHPGGAGARRGQRPVGRARGHRPAEHPAADRLHLGLALRLHRARHLRAEQLRPVRLDALHVQPRDLHGRAVPGRRLPGAAPRVEPDQRLRGRARRSPRCWPGCSWSPGCPRCRCPGCRRSSPSSWCCWARSPRLVVGRRRRPRHRAGRPLHPADVPTHDDRPHASRGRRHARPEPA